MIKYKCDYHYVDSLVNRYTEAGGNAIQLNEGTLASVNGFYMKAQGN